MTADPASALTAAQCAAGVIAARHRGDVEGAEQLLAMFPDDATRTRGFMLLAELALTLVRAQTGQSMEDIAQEMALHIAAVEGRPPTP
ncbi:superoxide dismutase [Micromonospora sp. CPCC 205561]|uniref:superoxide dismutase n=1 Tax=Micromonospora sp. CPCC 205561 TaxID=3122407 RepID=UPI002FF2F5C3